MAHLFNTVRIFFARDEQQTTQEWLRLQFIHGASTGHHNTQVSSGDDNDDVPRSGLRPKRWNARSSRFLCSLAYLSKSIDTSWNTRFPGWRSGIAGFSMLATTVLLINISALVWTATHLDDGPFATIAVQSCENVSKLSSYVQFSIIVLSAGLLAGSNYCMQCLSSPTRDEVDAAHAHYSYLNVGILSWRNVVSFRKRRICLLLALALSSVPLHLVYNSAVSINGAAQVYDTVVVTPEFFSGGTWSQHGEIPNGYGQRFEDRIRILQDLAANGQTWNETRWANLSAVECKDYKPYESDRGSVLVVMEGEQALNFGYSKGRVSDTDQLGSVLGYAIKFPDRWSYMYPQLSSISYCLSLRVPGRCRLQIHLWLLLTVVVLNIVKIACFLCTSIEQRGTPLMTLGDSVASFLRHPCPRSGNMCLLSEDELISIVRKKRDGEDNAAGGEAKKFRSKPFRYYHSHSFFRWAIYVTSCVLAILTSMYYYTQIMVMYRSYHIQRDFRTFWKMGFGNLYYNSGGPLPPPWCNIYKRGSEERVKCQIEGLRIYHMLFGSLPQLIVSIIYVAMNYQITVMVQLREWARLASRRQSLRVSDPEPNSDQVSTYWLTLPYRYSIPLLISSVVLGWLVSQALFFYRVTHYDNDGQVFMVPNAWPLSETTSWIASVEHGLGYSALGVACSILFGVAVFAVSLVLGFRKCAPGMPLGPTNSLVIAAACHPPASDRYAARKPVKWGAIHSEHATGRQSSPHHCTITSRRVETPVEGQWYA